MERFVILGGGTAGRRAAEMIRKKNADVEISVIEEEKEPFYYRPLLGGFLSRKLKEAWILSKEKEKLSGLGIRFLLGVRAASLDVDNQEIVCEDGEKIPYDKLLIASGRKAARIPGDTDTEGIAYLNNLTDARKIEPRLDEVQKAVVVGSSIPALDALRGLRGRGIECTYLIPEDRFWPAVFDTVASEIIEDQLEGQKIILQKGCEVQEVIAEGGGIKEVLTTKGDKIPADLLVVAAPLVPELDFLKDTDLEVDKGILVDASLRTKRENVFAAGDVAQVPMTGGQGAVLQPGWLNAWRQGNVAGLNMAGMTATCAGVPSLRIKIFDLDVVCLGLSSASGEGIKEESGDYPYEELPYIYKNLVYQNKKIAGAIFIGDVSEAGKVEHWIRKGYRAAECDQKVMDQMFRPRITALKALGALCPVCKFQMQVEEDHDEGSVIACPACGFEFRLKRMPNGVFRAEPANK